MRNAPKASAVLAGVFLLAACGSGNEEAESTAPESQAETAAAQPCTEETMMAKATELGEKMQGMAGDPAAMQDMTAKMQDIQAKVQQGVADGSFGIEDACAAYDELLATS